MGVWNQIWNDFGMILGSHFESFLGLDGLDSMFFCWACFQAFASVLGGIMDSWSSQNKVIVKKVLQKPCFRKTVLL